MIYKILLWFRGYISVEILGSNISRFLNICAMRNIEFINILPQIKKDNEIIVVTMIAADYFKLHDIIAKCNIKTRISKKKGFPFWLHKYRKRKIMFIGISTSFILMYILSLYIWQISVEGNFSHSDEEIIDFLEDNGIYHGINKSNIESERFSYFLNNLSEKSIQIVENNVKIEFNENEAFARGNIVVLEELDNEK